jgi:hypothetical protein
MGATLAASRRFGFDAVRGPQSGSDHEETDCGSQAAGYGLRST